MEDMINRAGFILYSSGDGAILYARVIRSLFLEEIRMATEVYNTTRVRLDLDRSAYSN